MMELGLNTGWTNQPSGTLDFPGGVLQTYPQIAATGAKWIRMGIPDPSLVDITALLTSIKAAGLKVLGLIDPGTSTPSGQRDWSAGSAEAGSGTGQNVFMDGLIAKFKQAAAQYAGLVAAYEVWNEPNAWTMAPGQGGSYIYPSNWAYLLKNIYPLAARVPVVSGGLFQFRDAGGLHTTNDYLSSAIGYGAIFDYVGIHPYVYASDLAACFIGNKPLFVTEFGYNTAGMNEAQQATNLSNAIDVLRRSGRVAAAFWFKLQDSVGLEYGLLRLDSSQKSAYRAFRGGVFVEQAALQRWSSFFLQLQALGLAATVPPTGTGIYQKWYTLYLSGHQIGPATSHEYAINGWDGSPGVAQDFGSWRIEWFNSQAYCYGPMGTL